MRGFGWLKLKVRQIPRIKRAHRFGKHCCHIFWSGICFLVPGLRRLQLCLWSVLFRGSTSSVSISNWLPWLWCLTRMSIGYKFFTLLLPLDNKRKDLNSFFFFFDEQKRPKQSSSMYINYEDNRGIRILSFKSSGP